MINRYREQARSHRGFAVFLEPAMAFEMLIDLRRRHFLQAHQQIVGQLPQPVLLAQLLSQMRRQVRRHLRIRHRPVSLAGVRQVGERGKLSLIHI